MSDCRDTDALNKSQRLIKGKGLRLMVMRELWKGRIDELDTPPIGNRPVGSSRN